VNKNSKILYCILGSAILALLNNPMFSKSKLGLFQGGYGGNLFGMLLVTVTNILSLAGFILLMVFSIMLIIRNIHLKDK
jgi:hypothetical protein